MIEELIKKVLILPVLTVVEPLRGEWSSLLGPIAPFFHLLPLFLVPRLILAAPIAFSVEGLLAGRVGNRRGRVLVAVGGGLVYALLTHVTSYVAPGFDEAGDVRMMMVVMLPFSALGIFGFWLPSMACGTYTTLAKRPRWWVAGLLGTAALIVGVWLWIVLGTLVGAPVD